MKWFLVAFMAMTYNDGGKDLYIWYNPTFDSSIECTEWVKKNNDTIYLNLMEEFPNDRLDKLFCIEEDKLEKFLDANEKAKSEQSI
jgi:hypothetical protein